MAGILDLMGHVQKQGLLGREQGKQNRLADLMGQAYTAPRDERQGLIGQMAQTDPGAAYDAEKHFGGMDDRARSELGQYAAAFSALPEEQKAQAYPQLAQQAQRLGLPVPMEYRPEMAPNIEKLAQTLSGGGSAPEMKSLTVGGNGNYWAIRNGEFVDTGVPAAANNKIMEGAGGVFGVNQRTLQASPVQMGGAPQQRAPGEVPFSIDPSLPPEVQAAIRSNESQFASAPDGANIPIGAGQMGGGQLQAAPPKVSPAEQVRLQLAQQAAARDEARLRMQQDSANRKTSIPGATTGGVNAQKLAQGNATKLAQFNTAERAIARLEAAANDIAGNPVFDGGPLDRFVLAKMPQGQELEQAGASLLPVLTALTRVPGVGAQSDLESRLATLQMPSAEFPPEVNKRAVVALRAYIRDLKSAYQGVQGQAAQDKPASSDIDSILDKYR